MAGFHASLDELWSIAAPESLLDVGCGEGVLTVEWAERLGDRRVVGIDLDDPKLARRVGASGSARTSSSGPRTPRRSRSRDDEFDMATAIEVLEHVPDPEATLAEMARVARRRLLVSVPREPLWRGLNVARGAYLGPARQHAGPREPLVQALVRLAARALRHGRAGALAVPVDDAPGASRLERLPQAASARSRLRPGRRDPLGGDRRHRADHLRVLLAREPCAHRGASTAAWRCCGRPSSSPSRCSTGRWSSCCRARSPTATRAA